MWWRSSSRRAIVVEERVFGGGAAASLFSGYSLQRRATRAAPLGAPETASVSALSPQCSEIKCESACSKSDIVISVFLFASCPKKRNNSCQVSHFKFLYYIVL